MNFLLEIDYNKGIYDEGVEIGGVLFQGLQIVLIGMLTVFAVLGVLWAFLTVFKLVFYNSSNKASDELIIDDENNNFNSNEIYTQTSDDELVAVIAAAIAAAESESGGLKYRVVSFRRK